MDASEKFTKVAIHMDPEGLTLSQIEFSEEAGPVVSVIVLENRLQTLEAIETLQRKLNDFKT